MYKGKTILATVCARGGSKGVTNKNIRPLDGKPIIVYTLDNVRKSHIVDNYVVSTDSGVIAILVKDAGFAVKFKRPDELAGDKVSRIDAIKHAVKWLEQEEGKYYDIIVDLGVATPLKSDKDLDDCIKLLIDSNADNVISACNSSRNPYFNMVEIVNSRVQLVKEMGIINDRRDAPDVYDLNDAFNVWKHDALFKDNCQFNENTKIFVMPRERSVDIDEEFDFTLAEFLIKQRSKLYETNA